MRSRLLGVLAASALLASVAITMAPAAGAGAARPTKVFKGTAKHFAAPNIALLPCKQIAGDTGVGISSQNFSDPGFDIYDDSGADDCVIPAGRTWTVQGMRAYGTYAGFPGVCDTETVTLYADAAGKPGAVLYTDTGVGTDAAGVITLKLTPPVVLGPGPLKFWVAMVCNMNFTPDGQWYWLLRTPKIRSLGQWQNPGNGFATGCVIWTDVTTCTGSGDDYEFALAGTVT